MVTIIYLHDHHLFSILYWFTVFFKYFFFILVSQGALQGVSTTNVRRLAREGAQKKRALAQQRQERVARVNKRAGVLNLFELV